MSYAFFCNKLEKWYYLCAIFWENRVLISCTNRHETIFYKERIEAEKEKTGYDVGMHGGAAGSIYRSDLA